MTLQNVLEHVVTIVIAIFGTSGFWAMIERKRSRHDLNKRLLIGLAHDRIVSLSLRYIRRGHIFQDEYENLHDFLFKPYIEMGGNGTAARLMIEVDKLPIKPFTDSYIFKESENVSK